MRKTLIVATLVMACGCMTTPKVESTKQWEGHYMTVEEFSIATQSLSLEKDESIWVLSNSTLKRLLKNTGK